MTVLTEQDTYFGTTAYRNKLITREQLTEAVMIVTKTPGLRLGEVLVQKGYITEEQVAAILSIQKKQREILQERTPPTPPVSSPQPPPPTPAPSPPREPTAAPPESSETPAPKPFPSPSPAPEAAAGPAATTPKALPISSKIEHLADYLALARAADASDLHISAEAPPFLRRSGRIEPLGVGPLPACETERLLFEVLSGEQKTQLLDRLSLETCIDVPNQGRYRATVVKQRLGWDGIFHVIRNRVPTMEELGLPDCLKRLTEYHQGLVLATGPGNCGKSTTLAALVDAINRTRDDHIITIEKPIEYVHTPQNCQVTQREVGRHTESFAAALRAALREDPDVIMVGELRDLETFSMAISASETGHLVLGAVHTTSAARTVSRILDGFPVAQQGQIRMMLAESLRGVVSQQLVPRKDGQGVALALEILFITPSVAAVLRDNKPFQIPSIMQTSRKMGMCQMDDSLLELAAQGLIDGAEAYRRADNKRLFEQLKPVVQ